MNRNEQGTPVDNEMVADAVGTEIQTRPASVEKPPAGVARGPTAMMRGYDRDGDGNFSRDEVRAMAVDFIKEKKSRRVATKAAIAMGLTLLLVVGLNAGLTAAIVFLSKDTYIKGDTTMSDADGKVVGTRVATQDLPLIVASVLPLEVLFSVETLRVTLPGSPADPAEAGSGEVIMEDEPNEINSFRISRVQKVNSTAVVFHALGGEQVRVWNGVTTVRLSAIGPEIPVCSANVTCAAFQVEDAELAEKYLAEAEALLEPFEEGRRRLAEECRDPYTSAERDDAQALAQTLCQGNNKNRLAFDCHLLSNQAKLEAKLDSLAGMLTTTFTTKASLKTAIEAYNTDPTAAIARYGQSTAWNVSAITDMSGLFENLHFFDAYISNWDTSKVTDMSQMFRQAYAFNQPLSWDTSSVTDMHDMFFDARAFNQPLSWDISSVTDMWYMFDYANSLSAANKLLIRCAWAGNSAFPYGSSWGPGSCA